MSGSVFSLKIWLNYDRNSQKNHLKSFKNYGYDNDHSLTPISQQSGTLLFDGCYVSNFHGPWFNRELKRLCKKKMYACETF